MGNAHSLVANIAPNLRGAAAMNGHVFVHSLLKWSCTCKRPRTLKALHLLFAPSQDGGLLLHLHLCLYQQSQRVSTAAASKRPGSNSTRGGCDTMFD